MARSVLTAVCGVTFFLSMVGGPSWFPYLSILTGSIFSIKSAWQAILDRDIDVNHLMLLAAGGAILIGEPTDAAGLFFLFSLSGTLEHYTMSRTQSAIEGLIKLRPDSAILVGENGDRNVNVNDLKIGDLVRIPPFATIPTDGTIEEGRSSINQAAMTGESEPVDSGPGDAVLTGTQNLDGMLLVRVSAEAAHSALEKIVGLVSEAQENKGSGERISQWFGKRYTAFVFLAFLSALIVRMMLGQNWDVALYGAIVLLVALSPCALVISTPATILSALSWAARRGILVRGGEFLESVGEVKVAAVDKTGTLTLGKPELVEICVCTPTESGSGLCLNDSACWHGGPEITAAASEILRAAAAAEQYSTHPLAQAIVSAARTLGIEIPTAHNQKDTPGLGVEATIERGQVWVGQKRYFSELPSLFEEHLREIQAKGMTVAICRFNGAYAALGVRDVIRESATRTVSQLKELGVTTVMLTGDNENTAKAVADEVGIDEHHAALLPADKTKLIEEFESLRGKTLMVGDGINDAPSLTKATVGVAMGGLGSDIALNAADIVLMNDRIENLPQIIQLGRKSTRIIKANLIFAAGVIVVLATASFFTKLPLPLAVLGHEGSTVLVILNGLRMLGGPGES